MENKSIFNTNVCTVFKIDLSDIEMMRLKNKNNNNFNLIVIEIKEFDKYVIIIIIHKS